jgi:amino acid adenylation domain-containing protein
MTKTDFTNAQDTNNDVRDVVALLRRRAELLPHHVAFSFLPDRQDQPTLQLSFLDLDLRARSIAARLQQLVPRQQPVLLLFPPGLDFIAAFFACLYAGLPAVPAYPPRLNRSLLRLHSIISDAKPSLILTSSATLSRLEAARASEPSSTLASLPVLITDEVDQSAGNGWLQPAIAPGTLAFLQYTSGSTAEPKGVMITHGNLLHNQRLIARDFKQSARSIIVGWLPLYHDMGLIGNVLQPLYLGARCVLLSPLSFLQRPLRWLEAISEYRATTSGGPNFAYELCVRRSTEDERRALDLSSWDVAFNGAEPVRAETMERFTSAFALSGFKASAFYPCYGLAEATLLVSGGRSVGRDVPSVRSFAAQALGQHRVEMLSEGKDADTGTMVRRLVGCGEVSGEQQVLIVEPESLRPCGANEVGEVWVRGESVAAGYWQRLEQSVEVFRARLMKGGVEEEVSGGAAARAEQSPVREGEEPPGEEGEYLRTGDLGFIQDGELYITGRIKELLILRGLNYYPEEIEQTVQRSVNLGGASGVVAFAVEREGAERLVIVAEVERGRDPDEQEELIRRMREAVMEEHEVMVEAVVLVRRGELEKTSSGKKRRHRSREQYQAGGLKVEREWRMPGSERVSEMEQERSEAAARIKPAANHMEKLQVHHKHQEPQQPQDSSRTHHPGLPLPPDAAHIILWLQELLSRSLGVSQAQIQPHEPIWRYGVDSLGAIELMHEAEQRWGVRVSLAVVLESATLTELGEHIAALLSAHQGAETVPTVAATVPTTVAATVPSKVPAPAQSAEDEAHEENGRAGSRELGGRRYPLSYGQQGLWYIQQSQPHSALYNLSIAMRLLTEVSEDELRGAFQSLVARHAALRTTFVVEGGEVMQRVAEQVRVSYQEEEVRGESEAEMREKIEEEAGRGMDLEAGPLLRVKVYRRGGGEGGDVMLVVAHHLVADFWSLAVMMEELGEYLGKSGRVEEGGEQAKEQAGEQGEEGGYERYVRRQREEVKGERGERARKYWEERLSGERGVVEIVGGEGRPAVQSYRGAAQSFRLSRELSESIKAVARQQSATLYMTLLAAFQVLLYRYTGQEDILVSSPTTGRNRAELAHVAGYFVNPVIVRGDLSGNPSFNDFLHRIRQRVLEAFEHQDYPFALLVERLQPQRDPSRPALAQVMFVLQKAQQGKKEGLVSLALNEAGAPIEIGPLKVQPIPLERPAAMFDLTLMMAERDGQLVGSLKYSTDLFDAESIRRMVNQFQVLLEGISADPAQRLSALPLLEESERRRLLLEWNQTATAFPQDRTIQGMFDEQAASTPDAVAAVYEQEPLTYAQLNSRANQLAHHLRSLGVGPEVRVGMCLERSLEMIVAWLGILKAGGAYVPLEPTHPPGHLDFMLRDADVRVVLTQQRLLEKFSDYEGPVVCLDTGWRMIAQEEQSAPPDEARPENLAYVIYTSGSTGKPKGVMVQHRSVLNLLTALRRAIYERYDAGPLRVGLNAPLIFDASVKQLITLLMGHSLYILPEETRNEGKSLLFFMERNALDVLDCTPSHLEFLLSAGLLQQVRKNCAILVGGEAITKPLWQTLAASQEITFYNLYGPTECTVDATACEVRASPLQPGIGRPLANTRAYLLDGELQPVPIGVPGELHLAGAGLARGYLKRPELTAEKFIPDPFSGEPGARLYRTGDSACYLPDGNIKFLERIDNQVKLRGFRIELGEIEEALRAHPSLQTALVMLREDEPGEKRLVAYLVPRSEPAPGVTEIRGFLKERLPAYMIPAAFVNLDALPLTASGKVDRRALPAPDSSRPEIEEALVTPRTSLEEALAGIFAQVLGLEEVGIYDNFFELGGHSLMATQLISQLQDIFPTDVPLLTLFFEDPTVAGLSAAISQSDVGEGSFEKIAEVLDRMGRLSDVEVEAMLLERESNDDVENFG